MTENMKLTVNTGALLIDVENEKGRKIGEFEFVPTDSNILTRYEDVVRFFNEVSFKDDLTEEETIQEMKAFETQIREQFDYLFGYSVSDGIFKNCGPLTVVSNGDYFFEEVITGIAGLIEQVTNERIEAKMKKVRKVTAKYHK